MSTPIRSLSHRANNIWSINVLSKYPFHDGSITAIHQVGRNIIISMESAQISSQVSKMKGKLHLESVVSLKIDQQPASKIQMLTNLGNIIRLNLEQKRAHFFIEWIQFPLTKNETYSDIIIEAEKIFWENIFQPASHKA